MKTKTLLKHICLGLLIYSGSVFAVGESSVITLVFPYGTPSLGMAETGTAIATDISDKSLADNLLEIQYHIGCETEFFNSLAGRIGFMEDHVGLRRELTFGIGLRALNHFQFDWAIITEPGRIEPVRAGQWRIDLALTRIFFWTEQDKFWWKTRYTCN